VPAAPGAPRVANDADIEWLVAGQAAFIAELALTESPERMRTLMPKRVASGHFWIWDDPAPVAYAGFSDAAAGFARVAPVYTLPERRGRGYATALVAALSRELLARGKRKLFLTTDAANPTSNAIYARIGYRPQNEDCHFDFVASAT
jgi:predicted GNAT family acetyltransferase